ncbi:hypothetical protein FF098_009765 [Parvularcula flava]|uniref:Uncharacterized protein n=1 Tax=Aquisalinus luteolus TaxID=1566827 RepID=A0A8J3A2B0_9PROT|nr:hypothetical protein [Aquisalinus luteolus]NHK28189.1 hypothetical protein [Aquisalinus luteolus]GGH97732.1 hypothetical protein GCM10011355_19660 [Aquisalinus luteolus]
MHDLEVSVDLKCRDCGSNKLQVESDRSPDSAITCAACKATLGTLEEYEKIAQTEVEKYAYAHFGLPTKELAELGIKVTSETTWSS